MLNETKDSAMSKSKINIMAKKIIMETLESAFYFDDSSLADGITQNEKQRVSEAIQKYFYIIKKKLGV